MNRSWEEAGSSPREDFEGFRTPGEEVIADVWKQENRKQKGGLKTAGSWAKLPGSWIKLQRMGTCFPWMNKESGFLRRSVLLVTML